MRAGEAVGHVGGRFHVAGKDVADRAPRLQSRVEGIDRRARHAEGRIDTLFLQNQDRRVDGAHPCHVSSPSRTCRRRTLRGCKRNVMFSIFSKKFFISIAGITGY